MNTGWVRLFVAWICGILSSGFMPGAPLFVPMLTKVGMMSSVCEDTWPCHEQQAMIADLFNNGYLISIMAMVPIGLAFDYLGGRFCGVAGAAIVTCSSLVLGFCIRTGNDQLLLPVIALCDIGCMLEGYCFFTLAWFMPTHMAFVVSLQNACYMSSAGLPIALEWLMSVSDMSLAGAITSYGALSVVSIVGLFLAVPNQESYYKTAEEVLGVPLSQPQKFDLMRELRNAWRTLREHMSMHAELLLPMVCGTAAVLFTSTNTDLLGRNLYQSTEGAKWCAHVTILSSVLISVTMQPFIASLIDRIGFSKGIAFLGFVLLVLNGVVVPSKWVTVPTLFASQLFLGVSQALVQRYFVYFAAPSRLGTVLGFFMGACSLLGVVALGLLMGSLAMGVPFLVVVMVINALGCFFWSIYSWRLFSKTLPSTFVLLDDDETDLARQFPGCNTLDDVVYITGLDSKEDLLQKLTSRKPEDMVELMGLVRRYQAPIFLPS